MPVPPGRRLRRAAAAALVCACSLGLSACGGPDEDASSTAQVARTSTLDDVAVSGAPGTAPTVRVQAGFSMPEFARKVLTEGEGAPVEDGQQVTVNYLGVNGTDGRTFDSSWAGEQPSTFRLADGAGLLPGIVKAVQGTTVGSRVLVAVPPSEAYGVTGMAAMGIGPTDTLVFVVDVVSARTVLDRAEGAPRPVPAGLPTVALAADGAPTVTIPAGAKPPAGLVVAPLLVGTGPKVTAGQSLTVHYTGVTWRGGTVFDSSWDRKEPARFTIGVGKLISGWDVGLVGQTVGSQVMLVVPPDKGYGAQGNPSAGITGTDTLVFVVDILDAGAATPSR